MAVVVAIAAWLVTSQAWAAEVPSDSGDSGARQTAPLCDNRGATMFGGRPVLDVPNASIDASDCAAADELQVLGLAVYRQGRVPAPRAEQGGPDAILVPIGPIVAPPWAGFALRDAAERGAPAGVHRGVERPPRA